jgi:hypothetical protein
MLRKVLSIVGLEDELQMMRLACTRAWNTASEGRDKAVRLHLAAAKRGCALVHPAIVEKMLQWA